MIPINKPSRTNYNNVGTRNNGFLYRIMPLSFNLLQKGNSNLKIKTTGAKLKIGDTVSGKNNKGNKFIGKIINIKYTGEETYKPTFITILDNKHNYCIDLLYDTVKLIALKESYGFDQTIAKLL